MKKSIFVIAAFFLAVMAKADSTGLVIPLAPVFNPSDGHGAHPRTPIAIPVLFLDGYTLTAGDYTIGSTIQLLDDDGDVVFSSYV